LNVAKSYENMGNANEAGHYYDLTAASAASLTAEGYSAMVAESVAEGLKRVSDRAIAGRPERNAV
jgi:hypothetical protein